MLLDLFTSSKTNLESTSRHLGAAALSKESMRTSGGAERGAPVWPVRHPGGSAVNGALWTRVHAAS